MMHVYDMLKHWLENASRKRLLYLCHKNADADAIGSAFVLRNRFRGDIGAPECINRVGKTLCKNLEIDVIIDPDVREYDHILVVDTSNPAQLNNPPLKSYAVIDHHATSELRKGAEIFINQRETSTAEIIFKILRGWKSPLTQKDALALVAGVITDTGHLKHATSRTFYNLGRMLSAGRINYRKVLGIISSTPDDPEMRSEILRSASQMRIHRIMGFTVVCSKLREYTDAAASALVSLGADLAIVGTDDDGVVRLSIRSRRELTSNGLNLGELMSSLGRELGGSGGGHTAAAGLEAEGDVDELIEICLKTVAEHLTTKL
ncbi:bifunctional oligoribonuclease/PAP phosphatase NrnA [Methanosarcinales archaeon]|nr:MAG: bifunctional oligoribonuclease/PAP phosphatase NrnA [Methanosarcinales archaeon]